MKTLRITTQVFLRDVRRLLGNPIALIVILGVIVLPGLYAWYNIIANWDPYSHTAGIRVAVVNNDKGVHDDTVGDLNVGSRLVEELEANDAFGWDFVDEDQALKGVRSNTYYAALVIPDDFSSDFVSVLHGSPRSPTISYYVNEKRSAVAVKVTDTGANAIEQQIDQQFVQVVSKTVVDSLQQTVGEMQSDVDSTTSQAQGRLHQAADEVGNVRTILDQLSSSMEGWRQAVSDAQGLLSELQGEAPQVQSALDQSSGLIDDIDTASSGFGQSLGSALVHDSILLGTASAQASSKIGLVTADLLKVQGDVDAMTAKLQSVIDRNEEVIDVLRDLEAMAPSPQLEEAIERLQGFNDELQERVNALQQVSDAITSAVQEANAGVEGINEAVQGASSQMLEAGNAITSDITPHLSSGLGALSRSFGALSEAVSGLSAQLDEASGVLAELDGVLVQTEGFLSATGDSVQGIQESLRTATTDLSALSSSVELRKLADTLGSGDAVGSFMSTPIRIDTQTVYPVENYGSAVSPFYTNLALWVGCFVLIAIIKLEVDRADDGPLASITASEAYLGRWMLFVLLAIAQAFMICGVDLLLGIQCEHPVRFLLVGVVISFTFMNIVYMLALTFKHIGKALGIIYLIVQIPGASGMYPVEMMPRFFQVLHPLMPFTYGIHAMRETIAGMYALSYLKDIAILLFIFVPITLLVGLVARPYLLNLNLLFDRKLHETGFMVCEENGLELPRYRLRRALSTLISTDAYRDTLIEHSQRFDRKYRTVTKVGPLLVALPPLLLITVFSIMATSPERKVLLITALAGSIVLIDGALIIIEYVHETYLRRIGIAVSGGGESPTEGLFPDDPALADDLDTRGSHEDGPWPVDDGHGADEGTAADDLDAGDDGTEPPACDPAADGGADD